jgi:hypothetical protein
MRMRGRRRRRLAPHTVLTIPRLDEQQPQRREEGSSSPIGDRDGLRMKPRRLSVTWAVW